MQRGPCESWVEPRAGAGVSAWEKGAEFPPALQGTHLQCLQPGMHWAHRFSLSVLHSGVQVCLFPVLWSGINCAEMRGMGEESSGASRVGLSVWVS